jgi:hypothetical protein
MERRFESAVLRLREIRIFLLMTDPVYRGRSRRVWMQLESFHRVQIPRLVLVVLFVLDILCLCDA